MININYHKITKYDVANGPGIRVTLWTSGCSHHCVGCQNANTWDPTSGNLFTSDTLKELLDSLSPDYIRGLTLSGGDPLYLDNRYTVEWILSVVKEVYPNKDIWMWTGYEWEEVKDLYLMEYVDVLVDGKFILEQRDITLPYSGSPNQRVIDVKKSLESGEVVLYNIE